MRRILIGTAAAALAISFTAAPALAQYGGTPDDQVDQPAAPGGKDGALADDETNPDDSLAAANPDLGDTPSLLEAVEDEGPPPEGYQAAAIDADVDADVDVDVDADLDADQGEVDQGDADREDADMDEGEADRDQAGQSEDGRSTCRRSDGTTGLLVGGGAGALVGHGIDRHGERGTGTVIGVIAGALVGSAIERGANERSCR